MGGALRTMATVTQEAQADRGVVLVWGSAFGLGLGVPLVFISPGEEYLMPEEGRRRGR